MRETRMARRTFLQLTGAAAGAALLAGCGERAESAAESGTEPMVTVLMPGQSDETACVRISAALSEVTKQKLGFSVSIEQVAPTNYSAELWKRMVCQTMPDLFFLTENQPLDVYLNQNCILPLSALLEEYPGLKALFSEQQWASRTYYRRIYAVPARAVSMYQIGFLARVDWMRELDARPEEITDLDALHDLLMQVRQRRPNAEGVLPDNGQVFPFPELDPLLEAAQEGPHANAVRCILALGAAQQERCRALNRSEALPEAAARLTERELALARLIADRCTNKEIAARLFLSEGTVKQYTNQLYSKLGIGGGARTKRAQLAELFAKKY